MRSGRHATYLGPRTSPLRVREPRAFSLDASSAGTAHARTAAVLETSVPVAPVVTVATPVIAVAVTIAPVVVTVSTVAVPMVVVAVSPIAVVPVPVVPAAVGVGGRSSERLG